MTNRYGYRIVCTNKNGSTDPDVYERCGFSSREIAESAMEIAVSLSDRIKTKVESEIFEYAEE